jgi:hypothetical protein
MWQALSDEATKETDTSWSLWTIHEVAEADAIRNQEASTVAEARVCSFCRFGVPRELHSDHDRNFESRLITGFTTPGNETITPLHP